MTQGNSLTSGARLKESRDAIVYQIERYASLPATFRNSIVITDNSALQNCILGNGVSPCKGDGTEYPVSLYAPYLSSTGAQRLTNAGPVTDNVVQPVLFDTRGNLCQTGAASASLACPFEVFTTFTAKCPAAIGSPCPMAESIKVHYVIRIPENVFSGGIKEKIVLATTDKFAGEIQTKDILPPAFGYVPNKVQLTSLVAIQPGLTTTTTITTASYAQVREVVLSKFTGTDKISNVDSFAGSLYNFYKVSDLSLVAAYCDFLLLNSEAAYHSLGSISYHMQNEVGYTITAAEVGKIAAATAWITDVPLARAIAGADVDDITLAQTLVTSLTGIINGPLLGVLANVRITDRTMSQAINASLTTYPVSIAVTWGVVSGAKDAGITDSTTLNTSLSLLTQAGVTKKDVAYDVITKGITDLATITQMEGTYAASAPPSTIIQPSTTATPSAASTPVPVALSPVCDSSANCASTPSSF